MLKIKGSMLLDRLAFLRSKGDENAYESVLGSLADEDRKVLEGHLLPSSWYPCAQLDALVAAIDQHLGRGDLALAYDMGYFAGRAQLHGVYDSMIRRGNPEYLLRRAPSAWSIFCSSGRLLVTEQRSEETIFRILELRPPSRALCDGVAGWFHYSFEASGARDVRLEHLACAARGAEHCEMRLTWQSR